MAPEASSAAPARRKGPSFKPPRPVHAGAESSTASAPKARGRPKGSTNAAKSTAARPKAAAATSNASGFRSASHLIPRDEREEDEMDVDEAEAEEAEELDAEDLDGEEEVTELSEVQEEPETPAIPPKLLVRLLHEHFENKDVRVGKEAMDVIQKYMETFVREAIARARFEREEVGRTGTISDEFLQIEDLERLAPQLILDF